MDRNYDEIFRKTRRTVIAKTFFNYDTKSQRTFFYRKKCNLTKNFSMREKKKMNKQIVIAMAPPIN